MINPYTTFKIAYNDTIISVIWYRNNFYVPIKPIIQRIGLDWRGQARSLHYDKRMNFMEIERLYIEDVRPDDSVHKMLCVSLASLEKYLNRARPGSAPIWALKNLEHYRASCARTLKSSLNSRDLKGVLAITTSNDLDFLDLVAKQKWNIEALNDLGVYADMTKHFSLD